MAAGIVSSKDVYVQASAALAGISAAVTALFIYIKTSDQKFSSDNINLIEQGFIESIKILEKGHNRINYLNAARILKNTRKIIDNNINNEYGAAYLAKLLRYSAQIRETAGITMENNNPSLYVGGRNCSLPEAFAQISIDSTTYHGEGFTSTRLNESPVHEGSLYEIYMATEFPSNLELTKIEPKFDKTALEGAIHSFPAIYDYVNFLRDHYEIGGNVYRKDNGTQIYPVRHEDQRSP